jgi:1,4-alpha-glucan branching enzyme
LLVPEGDYSIVLSSDNEKFGGYGLVDESQVHFTQYDKLHARRKKGWLMLYLPSRTALVLKKNRKK